MEKQMIVVQREIEVLRNPVFATIRPAFYPTPSPESPHENQFGPRTLHRTQPFQLDKTSQETSRFSMTASDVDSQGSPDNDEATHEVYGTPRENRFTFESARTSPQVGPI